MGIGSVHNIQQKDCTARYTTGGIWEIPDSKVNQVDTSPTGGTVQCTVYREGPFYVVYLFYTRNITALSLERTHFNMFPALRDSHDRESGYF